MASEHYSINLEALNIMCHQLTLPTMMMVPVPVRPVNETRPFLYRVLILQVITPLYKIGSGYVRLGSKYCYFDQMAKNHDHL